jgi:DNA-binding MarR family transcriptional regulator/GNAT superfamily N-acetyltransferase
MIEADHVLAIRRFSRFYTRAIGVLDESYFSPAFSLTEGRVLFELGARGPATASGLVRDLAIDPGYLSRILKSFETRGYVDRRASQADRRKSEILLTSAGRAAFETLDRRSSEGVATLIGPLDGVARDRLAKAMAEIEALLGRERDSPKVILRSHRTGDMGWVVERHGAIYAVEQGWGFRFEAMVAEIAASFLDRFDPAAERCWIAERDGVRVGCVFLVRESEETAKLRLLLVDPAARGLGLGRRLVAECIDFAREKGYRRLTLWTQSCLLAARRLYADAGFRLVRSEPYRGLGLDLVSETWELELGRERQPPSARSVRSD